MASEEMEEKQEKKSRLSDILFILSLIITLFIAVLSAACGMCYFGILVISAVFTVIIMLKRHSEKPSRLGRFLAAQVLIALFILSMPPLGLKANSAARYTVQKTVLSFYQNITEPEWFPDFSRVKTESFSFDYLPSVMQGTGHFTVCVTVSPEETDRYAAEYSGKAKLILTGTAPRSSIELYTAADRDKFKGIEGESTLDIYLDEKISSAERVDIYVLDGVRNWNHPHSSAVVIDRDNNRVLFSQLG